MKMKLSLHKEYLDTETVIKCWRGIPYLLLLLFTNYLLFYVVHISVCVYFPKEWFWIQAMHLEVKMGNKSQLLAYNKKKKKKTQNQPQTKYQIRVNWQY